LNSININPEHAVMIGDRPLTDILAGKLLGCKTILVGSINPHENLPTKIVRALERSTIRA
jgi:predicted HAD superfamily phosphohydrolase YqeG